jgi:hypothetical protein
MECIPVASELSRTDRECLLDLCCFCFYLCHVEAIQRILGVVPAFFRPRESIYLQRPFS